MTALAITPSHQQNMHVFADGRKNMNAIFNNYVCSASNLRPGLHFQNVWRKPCLNLTCANYSTCKNPANPHLTHKKHLKSTATPLFVQQLVWLTTKEISKLFITGLLWGEWFLFVSQRGSNVEHDDVIKWKHFPRYWPFVREIHRSPVNFPHKGQWRWALMFTLICARMNGWVNNREAGDLRRYRVHYEVFPCHDIIICSVNIKKNHIVRHLHYLLLLLVDINKLKSECQCKIIYFTQIFLEYCPVVFSQIYMIFAIDSSLHWIDYRPLSKTMEMQFFGYIHYILYIHFP